MFQKIIFLDCHANDDETEVLERREWIVTFLAFNLWSEGAKKGDSCVNVSCCVRFSS